MFLHCLNYDTVPHSYSDPEPEADSGDFFMVLLVLDDDVFVREAIQMAIGDEHKLLIAPTYEEAVNLLESHEIDGAIVDINLENPDFDGMDFLSLFKRKYPEKPVIVESGYRDVPTVVKCIKLGADDYLEKPFDKETLQLKISKVFADSQKTRVMRRALEKDREKNQIVGNSPGILSAKRKVEEAGKLRILFYGETGVGKTPFAQYSNFMVGQKEGSVRPFEQINCACLSSEQFQDQLFGHKKGAFTGAISDKRGLVELARGGDLFLDEIGEMPLDIQAMFLTFLDSGEYYRLGDDVKRRAEVRIIAATNRDLRKMVEEGKFRKDLYSRISQVYVEIPPLRDRGQDIVVLLEHFIQMFAGYQKPYAPEIIDYLKGLRWEEGNVRELRDGVEYMCIKARESDRIEMEHLSEKYRPVQGDNIPIPMLSAQPISSDDIQVITSEGLDAYMEALEKQVLSRVVQKHEGSLEEMARQLRVSRPTLYRKMKKFELELLN